MRDTLLELLNAETWPGSKAILSVTENMSPVDIAEAFDNLEIKKALQLFRLLKKDISAEVFAYIIKDKQHELISALTNKEQGAILDELMTDDAADMLEELPANVVTKILKNANSETRADINSLLKYPEDSAGAIMTIEYVRLKPQDHVADALTAIRKYGANKETIYTCYITDNKKTLVGVVSAKDLLLSDPEAKVCDIMTENFQFVKTHDDREAVVDMFKKYEHIALPVVDSENKLVGIVTVDDVLQVIEEENTEDIQIMAAVTPTDKPYLKTSVWMHSKSRIVWLAVLMLSSILTGLVIDNFENQLATNTMLLAYIPMLMGTGGNSGSQVSVQVIRGMALGELSPRNWFAILWKETRIALVCGVVLGALNFLRVIAFEGVAAEALMVALTVTLALCATVLIAKIIGGLLPLLAKVVHLDPALMAAPMITTIVDVVSLLTYFGLATLLFNI